MAFKITITDAGRAEVINAENTGTAPVELTTIGLGSGQYEPDPAQTTLSNQFKTLTSIPGTVVDEDTIHVMIRDDSGDTYNVNEFGIYTASGTLFAVYSETTGPLMQKAAGSTLLLAVDIILGTLNATSLTFGNTNFLNPPASETVQGVTLYATEAEHKAGTVGNKAATPAGVKAFTEQFGIGGYKAVADANLATESGLYSLPASLGATNSPIDGASGTLLVIKGGAASDYVSQVWFQSDNTGVFRQFIRHYRGDTAAWSSWLEMGAPVPASFKLTIGSTGDLPTLNDAIRELSARYPMYSNAGVKVTLELEAGFVMQEQVIARGIDLSWIEITGVDAETVVDRASLTVDISNGDNIYPVFGVSDGGKGPRISQLFSMNRSGGDFLKKGVYTIGAGSSINVSAGCGIKNVYGDGCTALNSAIINANSSNFQYSTGSAFLSDGSSLINCENASADNSGYAFYGRSATINARNATGTACSNQAVRSESGADVIVDSGDVSGCTGSFGMWALRGSKISATGANYRKGISDDPSDCEVNDGSIVSAAAGIGGSNVTPNNVSSAGILFKF